MANRRSVQALDLPQMIGHELGASHWRIIDQDRIDLFADLTEDRQSIHIDPEAGSAAGFGGTIAHGFLTLSLLSAMANEVLPSIEGAALSINYGFDRVRFLAPVPAGSNVKGHFVIRSATARGDALLLGVDVSIEIEGQSKPALVAEWLTLWRQS